MNTQYSPEVEYTNDYYHFMSPAMIDGIALNAGFVLPRTERSFAYCELGCGFGLTTNYLAATHPEGHFTGVDLSQLQIDEARTVAGDIGLDNARFVAADLTTLEVSDFPAFDYITLHGLYSWVPGPVRQSAMRFIDAKLKPGGRVFVSHDVLPGWHALMPIRDFMLLESRKCGAEDVLERTRHAMNRLRVMVDKRANFVASDPGTLSWANTLLKQDPRYVAHEYLVSCLEPQSFRDVADNFASIGLRYAGDSRETLNNFRLCVPAHLHPEIERERDPIERETLKDFLFSTTFRRSVFVRNMPAGTTDSVSANDQTWGLSIEGFRGPPEAEFPSGKCSFDHPVYQAILEQLRLSPRPWRELSASLASIPERVLAGALMTLFAAQRVTPFRMNPPGACCSTFNARQLASAGQRNLLLSGSFGGAVPTNDVERLYLHAHQQGRTDPAAIAASMHQEATRRDWYADGKALAAFGNTPAEQQASHRFAVTKLMQQDHWFRALGLIGHGH